MKEKEDSNKVNSSTMEEVTTKLNKFNMDIHKNVARLEASIKEVRSEMKKDIENAIDGIENRIDTIESLPRKTSTDDSPNSTRLSP